MKTPQSTTPINMATLENVILFDGVCKLCNGWSRFVIHADKKRLFKLATVQSEQGQQILHHFGLPTDYFDTMVYVENDTIYVKSAHFLKQFHDFQFPINYWLSVG